MPHYVAFHLGPHCLPKYLFTGIQNGENLGSPGYEMLMQCVNTHYAKVNIKS